MSSMDKTMGKTLQYIKIVIAILVAMAVWLMPPSWYGIPDMSYVERRMLAIVVYAVIMWISEAVPLWTTSISVIVLMLALVSNASFLFLNIDVDSYTLGNVVDYHDIMSTFSDPVLMLFLGGFSLAAAASSVGLDTAIAKMLLKPLGDKSEGVMLGFMVVTATLSMFMNNTATTALMLSVVMPILRSLPHKSQDKLPLTLSIPIAANIGGIATPVGTPSNTIALHYLNDPNRLGLEFTFGDWVFYMMPLAVFLVFISWLVLLWMFPFKHKNLSLDIQVEDKNKNTRRLVAITFIVTLVLWLCEPYIGLNMYVIGLMPLAVFSLTGIIGRVEVRYMNWEILWLVAGGIALGVGMEHTHLAHRLVKLIPFSEMDPWLLSITAGLVCFTISTFISNTASTVLLLTVLPMALKTNTAIGGDTELMAMVILGVTVCSSLAMSLPISTPPNALAYATDSISQKDMARVGLAVGIFGMIVTFILFSYLSFADYI